MTDIEIYACVVAVAVGSAVVALLVRLRQQGEAIEVLREVCANHKHVIATLGEAHKRALDSHAAVLDVHSEALDEMGRAEIQTLEVNSDDPDRWANGVAERFARMHERARDPDPIYFTTDTPRAALHVPVVDAPNDRTYAGVMEFGGRRGQIYGGDKIERVRPIAAAFNARVRIPSESIARVRAAWDPRVAPPEPTAETERERIERLWGAE